jgi:hypothetical protein
LQIGGESLREWVPLIEQPPAFHTVTGPLWAAITIIVTVVLAGRAIKHDTAPVN